jgi:hypothetical protein
MSRQVYIRDYSVKRDADVRRKMMAKINIEFPKLRPDLRHSTEELRLERLAFCERVLHLRKPLESMRHLTNPQLERVIEAIKAEMPQGALPGCGVHHFRGADRGSGSGGEQMGRIHHLAGAEQVWAINQVLDYLGWSQAGRERFIKAKFDRTSPNLLTPKKANSLLMILFNIAASRDLKSEHGEQTVITKQMKARYIPELKTKLGIDQKSAKES